RPCAPLRGIGPLGWRQTVWRIPGRRRRGKRGDENFGARQMPPVFVREARLRPMILVAADPARAGRLAPGRPFLPAGRKPMRAFLLLSCALRRPRPAGIPPPLPRGPEAAARAPRADPAPEEKFAETPPTAPASLPERIERGAGGVRAALAAGYGRLWDRI